MKKHRRFLAMGLVAISLMLSGCGTPLYELTADEEELIVKYAAQFVAKHNIYQKDGVSGVDIEAWEEESEESSNSETQDSEDTQLPSGSGDSNPDNTDKDVTSMAAAIGLADGLMLTYAGDSVTDYVKEGAGYSVDAGEGFTFYVMKFHLKNTTEQDIEVDNVSSHPSFKLTSGSIVTKSSVSFLSTDLSTYKGTIKAGETVELMLLFKVNAGDAEKISAPVLQITIDGVTKKVKL